MFAANSRLNRLLDVMVNEVTVYAECQMEQIKRLAQIGIALSAEKDIDKLFELIIDEAMDFTNADAGTLYVVSEEQNALEFRILKNRTLNTHMGGTSALEIALPPVPLEVDGQPNLKNVSSWCAQKGKIVNIPDVYEAADFDFTGPRNYDQKTGYRSKSMLVIPMTNHDNVVTGVLQLLNAKDLTSGKVISFGKEYVELITSLASQAAVALENAHLIHELKELFEAIIKSMASAIDEKSPYTGGHIRRVTELTMMLAARVNAENSGPFAGVALTDDQLEELRVAAWLHDVGKIATPEHVIDKSAKLETVFDRIALIETRFELIESLLVNNAQTEKLALAREGRLTGERETEVDARLESDLAELRQCRMFVVMHNNGSEMVGEGEIVRLQQIATKTYQWNGETRRYLSENELENLSIRRGTLTEKERKIIENHALVGINFLKQLPFPKKFARVAEYAGGHHEKLDGSGYPYGLSGEQLSLQARIMALADVFEALTAADRPYKKPMKLSKALKILENMCEKNHIDHDLYNLFVASGIYMAYAEKELRSDQIDLD